MHTGNVVAAWVMATNDRLADALAQVGLDSRELAALTLVDTHAGCSVEWLRARVGLSQSGTVRLVDRLATRGLLRRGPSTGRGVPLHLTTEGELFLRRWHGLRDEAVDAALSAVPVQHRRDLVDGIAAALLNEERDRRAADATCRSCSWSACGRDCPVDRSVGAPEPGR
jgi:DNA-binding MarR family transcriptional regulator